jgi:hypothetical protein
MRGVHLSNPVCYCEGYLFSRIQIAGWEGRQAIHGAIHFVCAVGKCNFFEYLTDDEGHILGFENPPDDPRSMGF